MENLNVPLYPHQEAAVEKLGNAKILCGGVGTGKSRTAIAYYITRVDQSKSLYIITTAAKRNKKESQLI